MKGISLVPQKVLLLMVVVLAVGCFGGESRDTTAPVSGVVTFNGEKVEGAIVTFTPAKGRLATGVTDAEGVYKLTTYEDGDGAVVGSHKVSVMKASSPPGNSPEELENAKAELPEKYGNPVTSGLTAEVKEGQEAPIDFNLAE